MHSNLHLQLHWYSLIAIVVDLIIVILQFNQAFLLMLFSKPFLCLILIILPNHLLYQQIFHEYLFYL